MAKIRRRLDADHVSVVIPVFNAVDTLERAVNSLRSQIFSDWDATLVDDGSTDGSDLLAQDLAARDQRVHLLRTGSNNGAAFARNLAIRQTTGRYIAFLDADDEWLPEKLSRQIAFMQAHGAALSYTGFWRARGDQRRRVRVPDRVDRATLLKGNVIGCLTAIYDTRVFGRAEMPLLKMRQDFALWLELLSQVPEAHGLDEPLAVHHARPASLSASRSRATLATWRMYRQHLGLPAPMAAWYLSHHLAGRLRRG